MCIPSCAFRRVHSIVCISSCNRRRREEVKEDGGGWIQERIVFSVVFAVAVGVNWGASTGSVSSGSPSTGNASTRLYRSDCM